MKPVYAPLEQRQLLANAALVIAATGVAVQSTLVSHFPAYATYMPHVKMAFEAALVGGGWFGRLVCRHRDFSPPLKFADTSYSDYSF